MGFMGGVARAVGGAPDYNTISLVKNPALQSQIDQSISGYGAVRGAQNQALTDYINRYMAGQGAATQRTGQEIGALDQFYNGSMAANLGALRQQRAAAMNAAADVASQQALRGIKTGRVGTQGGLGSYNTRLAMANLTPIRVQAALDDATQARSDLGYLTQNQVGLAGQRQAMANQLAAYGLVPQQQRQAMLGQQAQYLGALGNLDQQNKFYGIQQQPNVAADILDSMDQGILNAGAMYGSLKGGMRGGGLVRGPGTGTSDSVPARLSKGEFVVPADVVQIPGVLPLLMRMKHLHDMHQVGKHQEMLKLHIKTKKEAAKRMKDGGYPVRMAGGGFQPGDFEAIFGDDSGGDGGGGGRGRGGGGGGLAGSAQQLGARVMADLTPTWKPAVILGQPSAPVTAPGGGLGGIQPRQLQSPSLPYTPGQVPRSPYFNPSNYNDLPQKWKDYGDYWSNYYGNPKSPGYIPPGTYD